MVTILWEYPSPAARKVSAGTGRQLWGKGAVRQGTQQLQQSPAGSSPTLSTPGVGLPSCACVSTPGLSSPNPASVCQGAEAEWGWRAGFFHPWGRLLGSHWRSRVALARPESQPSPVAGRALRAPQACPVPIPVLFPGDHSTLQAPAPAPVLCTWAPTAPIQTQVLALPR